MGELEKSLENNKELGNRVGALEIEKSELTNEMVSWQSVGASVQQLRGLFEAFQQSYAFDIDKLTGLLLDVQNTLTRRRGTGLLHRASLALASKTGKEPQKVGEQSRGSKESS